MRRYHKLFPEEEKILLKKATEPAGSGSYLNHEEAGIYLCKRCDLPLFLSTHKFHSGCGFPSFDEQIQGAVTRCQDADGRRVEILCSRCGAHLGHVFEKEGFTAKNLRHCVNSLSLNFVAAKSDKGYAKALFSGGCFWGVEYFFKQMPGVISTAVGYCGGEVVDPSYEEVCTGLTGHAESVLILYDETKTSFEALTKLFLEIHDPTQKDRQGPDKGEQYRSLIFYFTKEQKMCAERLLEELKKKGYPVVTQVQPASWFYVAEEFHQHYYEKTGKVPYCHKREKRF